MAEANGNGTLRGYLPLLITVVLAVAPVLVLGGRMINRLDYLENTVKDRGAEINQRFDQLIDQSNSRWQARDRQAESGDQRLRALAEMLIAQQRDFLAMAGTDSRQDETIKQAIARMERLVDRLNELERVVRPYPGGAQRQDHQ